MRNKCEPQPEVSVERKDFQGKVIYLVRLAEGEKKPYNRRDKGCFVRAGSTDRFATRIEMYKLYAQREPLSAASRDSKYLEE